MNFTSIFFENFVGLLSIPFKTLGTTESSASMTATSTSVTAADCLTTGVNQFESDDGSALVGTTSIASATATAVTYLQVNDIDYPDVQITKAYVESLDEEGLNELIANLDELQIEFDSSEEENILAKRI